MPHILCISLLRLFFYFFVRSFVRSFSGFKLEIILFQMKFLKNEICRWSLFRGEDSGSLWMETFRRNEKTDGEREKGRADYSVVWLRGAQMFWITLFGSVFVVVFFKLKSNLSVKCFILFQFPCFFFALVFCVSLKGNRRLETLFSGGTNGRRHVDLMSFVNYTLLTGKHTSSVFYSRHMED